MLQNKQHKWLGFALLLTVAFTSISHSCFAEEVEVKSKANVQKEEKAEETKGEKIKAETPKEESKESPEKEAEEPSKQSNRFTRFWIHTVGAPMARGLKDGAKIMHRGLKSGAHTVKDTFVSSDENK